MHDFILGFLLGGARLALINAEVHEVNDRDWYAAFLARGPLSQALGIKLSF